MSRGRFDRLLRLTGLGRSGTGSGGVTRGEREAKRPYVCRGCSQRFDLEYHVCPECGGYRVEAEFAVR